MSDQEKALTAEDLLASLSQAQDIVAVGVVPGGKTRVKKEKTPIHIEKLQKILTSKRIKTVIVSDGKIASLITRTGFLGVPTEVFGETPLVDEVATILMNFENVEFVKLNPDTFEIKFSVDGVKYNGFLHIKKNEKRKKSEEVNVEDTPETEEGQDEEMPEL